MAFSRLTGVLLLRGDGHDAAIRFEDGIIRALSGGAELLFDYETLAERAGAAPPDVIQQARSRPRRHTLRKTLSATDVYVDENFRNAVCEAVTEELLHIFTTTKASFEFEEGATEPGLFDAEQLGLGLVIDPESVVIEAARRDNEWHRISTRIGSEDEYYVAVPDVIEGVVPTSAAAVLLDRLDGTRDLRTAIAGLPHGRMELLRIAAQLIEQGGIALASAEQMRTLAAQAEEASEINRAARLLRSAIRHAGDDIALHRELVALYERAERLHDAATAYKQLGAVQARLGDVTSAATSYGEAVRLAPHDTDALRHIVAIHDARGDMRALLESGRRLADAYSSQGRHESALTVLQELLERDPADTSLREATVAVYIKLHDPQNAAKELLGLAESALANGNSKRALHYYRSVLAVDRSCSIAPGRIAELQSSRDKTRKRVRRRRRICVLLAVVLGLGLWQGARELFAQEALHNVAYAIAGADPAWQVTHYADVCRFFPWTRGAAHAEEMVRVLLLAELRRIRATQDLGGLNRLDEIKYPDGVKDLWRSARDGIRARASDWAGR